MTTDASSNGGAVRITNREIYDGLQALRSELSAFRIDVAADRVRYESTHAAVAEVTGKLHVLELKVYGLLAGLIGTFGGLVGTWVWAMQQTSP